MTGTLITSAALVISAGVLASYWLASTDSAAVNEGISQANPINYESIIELDAEDLAEGGMADAYSRLISQTEDLGVDWAPMTETWDGQDQGMDGGSNYRVEVAGQTFSVFGTSSDSDPWATATTAFFEAVNSQLTEKPFKFYAINAGNDLYAIRMTRDEFEAALRYHRGTPDAPYLPNRIPPDYGFPSIPRDYGFPR